MLKLMYITNDPYIAQISERAGVDRIFIDLETIGKEQRQLGLNTVKSHHTTDDVKKIRSVLKNAQLLVRINPIYEGSEDEIDTVIKNGADILMLPYFHSSTQVGRFLDIVNSRVQTILLVETPEAVEHLNEILLLDGFDECYIGLNDLHLGYKRKFMFELLADGTVDRISEKFRKGHIPFGFGGISRIGTGLLPAEKILAEHIRLESRSVILSRSFCDTAIIKDRAEIERIFNTEVGRLRCYETAIREKDTSFFEKSHIDVQRIVKEITRSV